MKRSVETFLQYKESSITVILNDILGDPEVTANLYCNFAYLYWECCVICSIYLRKLLGHPVDNNCVYPVSAGKGLHCRLVGAAYQALKYSRLIPSTTTRCTSSIYINKKAKRRGVVNLVKIDGHTVQLAQVYICAFLYEVSSGKN